MTHGLWVISQLGHESRVRWVIHGSDRSDLYSQLCTLDLISGTALDPIVGNTAPKLHSSLAPPDYEGIYGYYRV